MSKLLALSMATALVTAGAISDASAAPVSNALAISKAAPGNVETVRWRGGGYGWHGGYGWRGGGYGWRGYGWRGGGWGYYGGGFAAGALLGGLLTAPYYYGGPYYYAGPRYYYDYGPPAGDAVGYCLRRFKSYDPRSGTYLGYDGYRHPCP